VKNPGTENIQKNLADCGTIERMKRAVENLTPWWLYRLRVRWRMWRNSGPDLNRRVEVESALLTASKTKAGLSPERCRELAYKLGVPKL
jgi:hypothetical protein